MARRRQTRGSDLRPLLEPWLAAKAQRSKATAANYRHAVTRFLDVIGNRPLDGDSIGDFLDGIDGLAPGSRAAYISAVRSFLRHGQTLGVVDLSPVEWLVRPRVAVTSRNRFLTADEVRAVLDAARKRSVKAHAIVLTLATTGLRVSELAGLQWRHVYRDPQGNLGLLVVGKGGKEREIELTEDAWKALRSVRVSIGKSVRLDAKDKTPLIPARHRVKRKDGTSVEKIAHYSREVMARHVKRAVKDAGIDKPASPHWLRHSFGTMAVLGGVGVFALRDTMGHSRLETTQMYVHWVHGLAQSASRFLPPLS